jgi:hypothetical protein
MRLIPISPISHRIHYDVDYARDVEGYEGWYFIARSGSMIRDRCHRPAPRSPARHRAQALILSLCAFSRSIPSTHAFRCAGSFAIRHFGVTVV